MRILLADDNTTSLLFLQQLLLTVRKDILIETAGEGTEAWEMLNRHDYDLLVSDHNMPGYTGVEIAHLIQDRMSGRIPVIIRSGDAVKDRLPDCVFATICADQYPDGGIEALMNHVSSVMNAM